MSQKLNAHWPFKKKETVVRHKTAEELQKEAKSKRHDKDLFDFLGRRHAGTSRNFHHALLQSDGYYKCTFLYNDKLLTCYTIDKPQNNFHHKVVCGYMPYHSNSVDLIHENKIEVPLNDDRVLWHVHRMMDTSTPEGLAIFLKKHAEDEAWKRSPQGKQKRRDRGLKDI
jgi:hypothetical protein